MTDYKSPAIERGILAAEARYSEVLTEYQPVESPSGILNRVGISRLYAEKFGKEQELIDWRLRMHVIGRMTLPDTLISRIENEYQQIDETNSHSGLPNFEELECLWEVREAAEDHAVATTGLFEDKTVWNANYNAALDFFREINAAQEDSSK